MSAERTTAADRYDVHMRRLSSLLVVAALCAALPATTGCIAFRAFPDPADARDATARQRAKKVRGAIATSVGLAELAIGVAVGIALAREGLVDAGYESENPSENPAGAAGQGVKGLGADLLATAMFGAISIVAAVSGLGDVVCGATDLLASTSCNLKGGSSEETVRLARERGRALREERDRARVEAEIGRQGAIRGVTR